MNANRKQNRDTKIMQISIEQQLRKNLKIYDFVTSLASRGGQKRPNVPSNHRRGNCLSSTDATRLIFPLKQTALKLILKEKTNKVRARRTFTRAFLPDEVPIFPVFFYDPHVSEAIFFICECGGGGEVLTRGQPLVEPAIEARDRSAPRYESGARAVHTSAGCQTTAARAIVPERTSEGTTGTGRGVWWWATE